MLALLDTQAPWKGSQPHRWEDIHSPHSNKEGEEAEKRKELKQLTENLKDVFLDSKGKCHATAKAVKLWDTCLIYHVPDNTRPQRKDFVEG